MHTHTHAQSVTQSVSVTHTHTHDNKTSPVRSGPDGRTDRQTAHTHCTTSAVESASWCFDNHTDSNGIWWVQSDPSPQTDGSTALKQTFFFTAARRRRPGRPGRFFIWSSSSDVVTKGGSANVLVDSISCSFGIVFKFAAALALRCLRVSFWAFAHTRHSAMACFSSCKIGCFLSGQLVFEQATFLLWPICCSSSIFVFFHLCFFNSSLQSSHTTVGT